MTWASIADCLGISIATLFRRREQLGIAQNFHPIPDNQLDAMIREIIRNTPNAGAVLVQGSIVGRGLSIQRWRIRERLNAVDPVGTMFRRRHAIRRRVYNVRGPNHLW
ncbi:hypothetical protein SKAU_G00234440 [Synaphobranchus kaupii]|uniref:Uncharacterized protein n=1 Tax=Synaphobranchus kaupii TaxID=118154 RepID=A0A9Q1IRJ6_SYNKA|nr:hypothetical protein SKAU_G00234440 [Synaphobranchus kaupii]